MLAASMTVWAQEAATPFEYPVIPDTITEVAARANYMVKRFWNKADMKKLLDNKNEEKLSQAFSDYVLIFPYASSDSVKASITALMLPYRNDAKATVKLVAQAEKHLFGPEAEVRADFPYMTFTREIFRNKKVNAKEKTRYMEHVQMINGSQSGSLAQDFSYTTAHGATHTLYEQPGEFKVVFFHGNDCPDCSMTRLRISADGALSLLSKNGKVKIMEILTEEPDPAWLATAKELPYEWEVGYTTDAGHKIDLRQTPVIYLIGGDNKVIARDLSVESLLTIAQAIYKNNQ